MDALTLTTLCCLVGMGFLAGAVVFMIEWKERKTKAV